MRTTNAHYGPAWRESARKQRKEAMARRRGARKFYTGPALIVVFAGIQLLLAARILGQVTSQDPSWWPFAAVLFVSDILVQPFRSIQAEPALKQTGVVEFASLVAFEAYLVAFLTLIFLIQVVHIGAWFVRRNRGKAAHAPATEPVPAGLPSQPAEAQQAA